MKIKDKTISFRPDKDLEPILELLKDNNVNISNVINEMLKRELMNTCPLCGQKIKKAESEIKK